MTPPQEENKWWNAVESIGGHPAVGIVLPEVLVRHPYLIISKEKQAKEQK